MMINKDAGELGSGHTVTALYEVIPVGVKDEFYKISGFSKISKAMIKEEQIVLHSEIMTIKLRYKNRMVILAD